MKNVQELYAALVKFPHLQKDLPVPDHLKLGLNITLDTVVKMTTLTRHSLRPNEKLPEITSSNFTSFSTVEGRGLQVDPATVINIAKSVWDIVRDNAGVVNISTDYATAMPPQRHQASLGGRTSRTGKTKAGTAFITSG